MKAPLIVAHRGASKAHRENTLDAFRAARDLGAAMAELDVRRTADGVLVVHHDPLIRTRAIIDMRADELPEHVPTLADALDACEGMDVNIEIKNDRSEPDHDADQKVAARVVELLRARGDESRMLISSFDLACIDRVRALDASLRTGYLVSVVADHPTALCRDTAARGHVAIHPNWRSVTASLVGAAHASGLALNTWTVDDPEEMRRLAALGVDAIITNVPDVAVAAFADA